VTVQLADFDVIMVFSMAGRDSAAMAAEAQSRARRHSRQPGDTALRRQLIEPADRQRLARWPQPVDRWAEVIDSSPPHLAASADPGR
jgi:hypothetical protein